MGELGLESTFAKMTQECGIGVWSDPQKVIAAFKDLAPKSEKELRLIEMFVSSGACQTLLSSKKGLLIDQKTAYHIAIQTMLSYSFYQPEAICSLCDDFLASIGINVIDWAEERNQYIGLNTPTEGKKHMQKDEHTVPRTFHDATISIDSNDAEESIYLEVEALVLRMEKVNDFTDEANRDLTDGINKLDAIRTYKKRRIDVVSLIKRAQALSERLDVEKNYKQGVYYLSTNGVEQNIKKAIYYLTLASEQGNSKASKKIGEIYREGTQVSKNCLEAIRWFKKATEQGDSEAARKLGYMYFEGLEIEQNYPEAVYWFKMAAEKGDIVAQCCLGQLYKDGIGVKKDMAAAIKWLELSANQNYGHAQWILGLCYEKGWGVAQNSEMAYENIKKAAENNNAYAQYDYGRLLDLVQSTRNQAFQWYSKAAHQGLSEAQYKLGHCYEEGWRYGIESNKTNAFKWYRESAMQGNTDARCAIGNCYCFGIGVNRDPQLMKEWWEKAARQGNSTASFNLGYSYEKGENGLEVNGAQAFEWYELSADQGYCPAQERLGELFYEGKLVRKDKKEALRWLKTAADNGSDTAKEFLVKHMKMGRLW